MGCWGTSPRYQIPPPPCLSIGSVHKLGPIWTASNISCGYGLVICIYIYTHTYSPSRMETATHVKPPCLSTFDAQQRCFHLGWDDFAANKGQAKGQMPVLMCRCRWHRPGIEGQVVNPTAHLIHGMPGWISVVPAWSKDESDFMDFDGTFWGDIWNS